MPSESNNQKEPREAWHGVATVGKWKIERAGIDPFLAIEVHPPHYRNRPFGRATEVKSGVVDVYESAIDHRNVFGCVFERDDETAYFYLIDVTRHEHRIISAFDAHRVNTMPPDIPTIVRFSSLDDMAGLIVDGEVLAVYDLRDQAAPEGRWATEADQRRFDPN